MLGSHLPPSATTTTIGIPIAIWAFSPPALTDQSFRHYPSLIMPLQTNLGIITSWGFHQDHLYKGVGTIRSIHQTVINNNNGQHYSIPNTLSNPPSLPNPNPISAMSFHNHGEDWVRLKMIWDMNLWLIYPTSTSFTPYHPTTLPTISTTDLVFHNNKDMVVGSDIIPVATSFQEGINGGFGSGFGEGGKCEFTIPISSCGHLSGARAIKMDQSGPGPFTNTNWVYYSSTRCQLNDACGMNIDCDYGLICSAGKCRQPPLPQSPYVSWSAVDSQSRYTTYIHQDSGSSSVVNAVLVVVVSLILALIC